MERPALNGVDQALRLAKFLMTHIPDPGSLCCSKMKSPCAPCLRYIAHTTRFHTTLCVHKVMQRERTGLTAVADAFHICCSS